jgi:hypothetical protein
MGKFSLRIILVITAGILLGCADDGSVEYASDNPGGYLHYISTDPVVIFHNKVDHEAGLEARGVEQPVGNASWHDYWSKMITYWTNAGTVGTHREVAAYIVEQRRARGLAPL